MHAIDAADFYVALSQEQPSRRNADMSIMRLDQLLYCSQELSLRKTGKPLFDDPIEAWEYGPVVRDVYDRYKGHHAQPLHTDRKIDDIVDSMSVQEVEILADAYSRMRYYPTEKLVDITHASGSP